MVNNFLPRSSKFCTLVIFAPYDLVQISAACGPYLSNNVWRYFWTSNIWVSNGNIKCPIGKLIFAVNLPLQLFRVTVANFDTGSLKFFHTIFDTYLNHMLTKFEPNRMARNVQNFELFGKKTFLTQVLTPFYKTFL